MRRIGALFINEMLKHFKKLSVFILIIIMTVGMIGCSSIYKIFNSDYTGDIIYNDPLADSYTVNEMQKLKDSIEQTEALLQDEDDPDKRMQLMNELAQYKTNIIYYDVYVTLASEYDISELSYRYELLRELENVKYEMVSYEVYEAGNSGSEQYDKLKARHDEILGYIKDANFASYIASENKKIQDNVLLTDARKEAQIDYNNALLKLVPDGVYESWQQESNVRSILSRLSSIKSSLNNNVDLDNGGNLTAERRNELERNLAIYERYVNDGNVSEDTDSMAQGESYSIASSIGSMISVIIVILLAGSLMSHEMSTGTIKSLIIAPVKRWKIFTAKYLSMIAVILFLSLYTFAVTTITNGLLFGFDSFNDKIVYAFGRAVSMNYFLYQLLSSLFNMITLIVVATFAYMMSIVTRNTAASVSVTMGIYLGGSLIHLLLLQALMNYPYVAKFLPFSNLDIFRNVFYSTSEIMGGMNLNGILMAVSGEMSIKIPTIFSVVYVIILLVCMIYIALDSFCRKDIK